MTVNILKTWGWCAPLSAGWIRQPAEATPPLPGLMVAPHLSGGALWPLMGIQDMAIMETDTHMRSPGSKDPTTTRYSRLHLIPFSVYLRKARNSRSVVHLP